MQFKIIIQILLLKNFPILMQFVAKDGIANHQVMSSSSSTSLLANNYEI